MKSYRPPARRGWLWLVIALALLFTLAMVFITGRDSAVAYYLDLTGARLRAFFDPPGALPTPASTPHSTVAPSITPSPTLTAPAVSTALPTATSQPTPTALPERVELPAPPFDGQDWNNCGPATLALQLRMFGWEGDQFTISDEIKTNRGDRNVNVDELIYYVATQAGWLRAEFRVGGEIDLMKRFLAAGLPIIIEEGFTLPQGEEGLTGPSDDRWTGHYLLLTGYDDTAGAFITQDTFRGADQYAPYAEVDRNWQAFNRVYLLVYRPDQADLVRSLLGPDADPVANRERALAAAQAEAEQDPDDAFAWFNVGSNQ
ncbi:MAG: hypothetical protein HPY76_09180, partial [Anaerolineae bacterium]|nr:hypothetical protein [Anaerolineae bacterium]